MANASVKLTRYDTLHDPDVPDKMGSYPLVIRAEGIGMADEIFVYHLMGAADPYTNDIFEAVATPNQIEELPRNQATETDGDGEQIPYYRSKEAILYLRYPEELEEVWNDILRDVRGLVRNYNAMNRIVATEQADIDTTGITYTQEPAADSPTIYVLQAVPATSVDLDGSYEIVTADNSKPGWLPVVYSGGSPVRPSGYTQDPPDGSAYYYNIAQHTALQTEFATGLAAPYSQHLLTYNGYFYSYGLTELYVLTADTIYWMPIDPLTYSDSNNNPVPPERPWADNWMPIVGSPSTPEISLEVLKFPASTDVVYDDLYAVWSTISDEILPDDIITLTFSSGTADIHWGNGDLSTLATSPGASGTEYSTDEYKWIKFDLSAGATALTQIVSYGGAGSTGVSSGAVGTPLAGTISLKPYTALTLVDISEHGLYAIDVSQNTALVTLNVDGNNLSTLIVTDLIALTTLNASNNQIDDFDFTDNTLLATIDVSDNLLNNRSIDSMLISLANNTLVSGGTLDYSGNGNASADACRSVAADTAKATLESDGWTISI